MAPVICVVGRKNSGKTTTVEALVRILTSRPYRVGTIKHDAHDLRIDYEGKDSWRHAQAEAATVVIASATKLAMVKRVCEESSLAGFLSRFFEDVEIVIAEGYRRSAERKLEVVRSAVSGEPICRPEEVMAFISDVHLGGRVPCFRPDQVEKVADLLERPLLKCQTQPCARKRNKEVEACPVPIGLPQG